MAQLCLNKLDLASTVLQRLVLVRWACTGLKNQAWAMAECNYTLSKNLSRVGVSTHFLLVGAFCVLCTWSEWRTEVEPIILLQAVSSAYPGVVDIGAGLAPRDGAIGRYHLCVDSWNFSMHTHLLIKYVDLSSGNQATVVTDTTIEVIVPQQLLGFIYGDNGSNLSQIRQVGPLPPLFLLTDQLGYCKSSNP